MAKIWDKVFSCATARWLGTLQRRRKVQKSRGGALLLDCIFLLLYSFLYLQNLGGGGSNAPLPPAFGDPVFVWMKTEGESKRVKILCHSLHIFPDFGSFLELIGYDPEKNSIKILLVIKWRTPFLSWFSRVNPISFSSRNILIRKEIKAFFS